MFFDILSIFEDLQKSAYDYRLFACILEHVKILLSAEKNVNLDLN